MTSKKELIDFTRSFPGADAQITGRMTNSYITGDTIEYKTITVQDSTIMRQNVNITNEMGEVRISGSLKVANEINCKNAVVNYIFGITMATGELIANVAVANLAVVNVIRATGVVCEGILMGTNEITYSDSNINISGNLNVSGDIRTNKKLSGNTLTVDTSIQANSISTNMSATFGKNLHVGGNAKINGSLQAGSLEAFEIKSTRLTGSSIDAEFVDISKSLTTPHIQLTDVFLVAKQINIDFEAIINYNDTFLVSSVYITSGNLTYGDKILFGGYNSHLPEEPIKFIFKGTWELTDIVDITNNKYLGTLSMMIFDKEGTGETRTITTYGEAEIKPVISKAGKITSMAIDSINAVTGGTAIYQGLSGFMRMDTNETKDTTTMVIGGIAINGGAS
jgi:hypothetical protein